MIPTKSPAEGDAGRVTVNAPEVVLQKYPSPAVAVKPVVLTVVCQLTWLSIVPVIETPVIVPVFVIVPEFCKAPPLAS